MSLADLSIRRPVFITAVVVILLTMGILAMRRVPVDMYPNVTIPIVTITTVYPGAGPEEVETLVSRIFEDEISTVTGIRTLRSSNNEGVSTVIAEFTLETDIQYAEQQIRDKISSAKPKLPQDIEEPLIRRLDPADEPVLILSLVGSLPEAALYDQANLAVRPRLEQVRQVGLVDIVGGRQREIHVDLDRRKLKDFELSATAVAARIGNAGQNIPAGTVEGRQSQTTFRTLGQFPSIRDIGSVVVSFLGNDVPITVNQVGTVVDSVKDETSRAFENGERSILLRVYRQSGANTIAVADAVKERIAAINADLSVAPGGSRVTLVRDGSTPIRDNIFDVQESIVIGILLTILVVYFFLGSGRSTFITGLALPNSLVGAFFLVWLAGFSINVMTLLALSLAVGLLIDDAIVVRENIFRHTEMGKDPVTAASEGTREVLLAVVATTFAVIAVFAPIGFLSGVVGQFFKEFGLTICFAMLISLFDAVTMAPMLSAYYAGQHAGHGREVGEGRWARIAGPVLRCFDRFQTMLEDIYERSLRWALKSPRAVLALSAGIFALSLAAFSLIPKTFLPPQDTGEFSVAFDFPPGTGLAATSAAAQEMDAIIRRNPEVKRTIMLVGGETSPPNEGSIFVSLVPSGERKHNTSAMKALLREQLKPYSLARPIIRDPGIAGSNVRPFALNISGTSLDKIKEVTDQVLAKLRAHPALLDVDTTYRAGRPEFQVVPDKGRAELLGAATNVVGQEIRAQIEGVTPAVFREGGEEYDIRVRLRPEQRNLREAFAETYVPNVNQTLIRLRDVAHAVEATGPSTITRQDRARYIQIGAEINPDGPGMGAAIAEAERIFREEVKLPPDMRYTFTGQTENLQELIDSILLAGVLGILFIYLVLGSLYESFITPFTILLVLPLAICGAFFALLFTGESLNVFSMIGCIMLMGVSTKNSILLVDYTTQLIDEGRSMADAVVAAGRIRLRPILMTSLALIAGMLPIAIGFNEASRQRTSMGVAVVGGIISSTFLTLFVVPAAFSYLERFRRWSLGAVRRRVGMDRPSREAEV